MFGFSPHCINESIPTIIAFLFLKLRRETKALETVLPVEWFLKSQVSPEGLMLVFFLFQRCHHVLKSPRVFIYNTKERST